MEWTIRKKVLLGYGAVLLLLALVLAWAFLSLLRLGSASDEILSENYRSIRAAKSMTASLERQRADVLLSLLGAREEGWRKYRESHSAFLQSRSILSCAWACQAVWRGPSGACRMPPNAWRKVTTTWP